MTEQTYERIAPELTIAEVARMMPQAVEVFEDAGIDYSCRGARSLADAAAEAGFSPNELIDRVMIEPPNGLADWYHRPLSDLIRYLAADHEETIRNTLRHLRDAIDTAAASGCGAEIRRISVLFTSYSNSVIAHMLNEERDLFPCIDYLERAANTNTNGPKPRVSQRVLREMVEHEGFQEKLRTMRELAWQLEDNDAVAALRDQLRACAREVHHHIHLENNVLYPRAIALENAAKRAV